MALNAVENLAGVRVAPQDLNAERAVLGALLISWSPKNDAFGDVVELLKPEDFYSGQHQIIYEATTRLFAAGQPVDAITIVDYLGKMGNLEKVGGADTIADLVGTSTTTANVEFYAKIVKNKAILRRLIEVGTRIEQLGYITGEEDIQNVIDIAEEEVYSLCDNASTSDYVSLNQGMDETWRIIENAKMSGRIDGVPTGLTMLDDCLGGLKPGQMVVVAARPGVGKSTLANGIAQTAAIHNKIPTIIFNLEMGYPEVMLRIISSELSIDHGDLRKGTLKDEEWERLEQFQSRLVDEHGVDLPLYIDDSANMSLMQIRTKCRRLSSSDQGLGLIIVDYLQLMQSDQRGIPRHEAVADISRKLKLLAKELKVPVIAIAQLNRSSEARSDGKPQLSDLRESGAIEQDADVVILIHDESKRHTREEREADPEKCHVGLAEIIVAKNRAGRTADFEVSAQLNYSRFRDYKHEL
ncbi:MAG: replicative DNA helicase [Candidatus Ancillula sp.]|nr:replicative DNA helicase [Candidatus Ancillula sp.]